MNPVDVNQVKVEKRAIAAEFGPVDTLVNNMGMGYADLVGEIPLSDWQ